MHFKIPAEVGHDDLTGHIILVGGVVWNEITESLSEDGEIAGTGSSRTQISTRERSSSPRSMAKSGNSGQSGKTVSGPCSHEDVGLLARVPNPLNSSRTLTICNGIHSRGVYGAVRSLTDTHLRDANERYISANFGNSASFAILMSVRGNKQQDDDSRLQQQGSRSVPVVAGHRFIITTGLRPGPTTGKRLI